MQIMFEIVTILLIIALIVSEAIGLANADGNKKIINTCIGVIYGSAFALLMLVVISCNF